jgi:hypothetical protein
MRKPKKKAPRMTCEEYIAARIAANRERVTDSNLGLRERLAILTPDREKHANTRQI